MECKSAAQFKTRLKSEIETSKAHWSELPAGIDGAEGSSAEKNREVFRSLQEQYNGSTGFFRDWKDDLWAVGEKIAEGAQGEIFKVRFLLPDYAYMKEKVLLKVFKLEGCSLAGLHKQWPPGMLLKVNGSEHGAYSGIVGGVLLKDGRFAFELERLWGDLWKVIDLRMEDNGNLAPSFPHDKALQLMVDIAAGMRGLHKDIVCMEPWIESLLSRCWDHVPSKRSLFVEIVQEFNI